MDFNSNSLGTSRVMKQVQVTEALLEPSEQLEGGSTATAGSKWTITHPLAERSYTVPLSRETLCDVKAGMRNEGLRLHQLAQADIDKYQADDHSLLEVEDVAQWKYLAEKVIDLIKDKEAEEQVRQVEIKCSEGHFLDAES